QVIEVKEIGNSFAAMEKGGSSLVVKGFDHYRKKPITVSLGSPVTPTYGNTEPTWAGERFDYVPFQSEAAAEAWALSRHRQHRYKAYTFEVRLKGALTIRVPTKLNMAGSAFRATDQQQGT